MLQTIKTQIYIIGSKRKYWLTETLLFLFIAIQFAHNEITYAGCDRVDMIFPLKLTLLAMDSGVYGYYFIQYVPFLLVLPAAFSYYEDWKSGELVYLVNRMGRKQYICTKTVAVFTMTFLAFFLPLLMECLLYMCAFPLNATGDLSGYSKYDSAMSEFIAQYPMPWLYQAHPYGYGIVCVFLFSVSIAVFSLLPFSLSTFGVKYGAALLVPVYVLLEGIGYLSVGGEAGSNSLFFVDYFQIYNGTPKYIECYWILQGVIVAGSLLLIWWNTRKRIV